MAHVLDRSLVEVAAALRSGEVSAAELTEEAIARHEAHSEALHAYKVFDAEGARAAAREADRRLAGGDAPAFCGIPVSVKDLYGTRGLPTFAGTARELPARWYEDAWLVAVLRAQGAVIVGKTHTVEMAYGGVGMNPHWGTPWNPWDARDHRIPGGSSCGAGVSLWEGSALVALGTDTGGSIRIPASLTGVVGHKTTKERWSTDGVVQLSSTLDSVGALTRSLEDSAYFFGAVDPAWGDAEAFLRHLADAGPERPRVVVPECGLWDGCQADIAGVLRGALDDLGGDMEVSGAGGGLLDEAIDLYMHSGLAGAECKAFLKSALPGWMEILHPTVGKRLAGVPDMDSPEYADAVAARAGLMARVDELFGDAHLLALPTQIATPPRVADLQELDAYVRANRATLEPTCAVGMLGLCSVTIPVGKDDAGMPVGLQLVARGGQDEELLAAALRGKRMLGAARDRLGTPPSVPPTQTS